MFSFNPKVQENTTFETPLDAVFSLCFWINPVTSGGCSTSGLLHSGYWDWWWSEVWL